MEEELVAIIGILSTFIGFPMVIVSYLKWRHQSKSSGIPLDVSARIEARIERIEQAIDTIALETERVAEGQRWLTKVLAEPGTSGVPIPRAETARQLDRPGR